MKLQTEMLRPDTEANAPPKEASGSDKGSRSILSKDLEGDGDPSWSERSLSRGDAPPLGTPHGSEKAMVGDRVGPL